MTDEGWRHRRWYNGQGRGGMIPLTAAIAIGSSLVTAVGAYYGHEAQLERRIAEVREKYVSKDELRERVEQPIKDMDARQRTMEKEQMKQGQSLEDIRRLLERNGGAPARPRSQPPADPR